MKTFKNMPIIVSILLLTMALHHKTFAQAKYHPGYVITWKGDTLKGEIEFNPKKEIDCYRKVKFRAGAGMPIKSFHPEKLKEYGMDSLVFIHRLLEDEEVFIKLILVGKLKVYEGRSEIVDGDKTTYEPDYYYMKGEDAIVIQDKPARFKKQMIALMSENAEIVKALEEEKYNFGNLLELFKAYNK